jgi:AcrR family transcriptional regulator
VAVTLAMARKLGFGQLSMRQIAAELQVTATALYYHFHNKNELLDHVAAHIMESIEVPSRDLPWTTRLQQLLLIQQRTLLTYPGLARFLLQHRESAGALRWIETILAVLHDAGFHGKPAARALATLSFFVHPLALLDDPPHAGPDMMIRSKPVAGRVKADASHYPHLQELLPELADFSYDTYLPIALERVITGLAAELESTARHAKKKG